MESNFEYWNKEVTKICRWCNWGGYLKWHFWSVFLSRYHYSIPFIPCKNSWMWCDAMRWLERRSLKQLPRMHFTFWHHLDFIAHYFNGIIFDGFMQCFESILLGYRVNIILYIDVKVLYQSLRFRQHSLQTTL